MGVPDRIRVRRELNSYTHFVGRFGRGGQFMAFICATLPSPRPIDWQKHKTWYAVLHTFAPDGTHAGTEAVRIGTTADGEDGVIRQAREERDRMVGDLPGVRLGDVEVALFCTEIDGFSFGLVDISESDEGYDAVCLLPNDLVFGPPWDGSYSS